MISIVKVRKVLTLGGRRLFLRFSDGAEGERDFAPLVAGGGPMLDPLKDEAMFARVFLEHGALAWPNGFDLDSTALRWGMGEKGEPRRAAAASTGDHAREPPGGRARNSSIHPPATRATIPPP